MTRLNYRLITILLVVIVVITLTASNIGPLQSKAWAGSGESIGVGALVILGAWGGYKMFSGYRQEQYSEYLEKGEQYLADEEYGLAIENLKAAQRINDSTKANQLLTEAKEGYQQVHYQQGLDYLSAENWELAYQEFKKVKKYGEYLASNLKREEAYQKLRQENLKRIAVIELGDNSYQYDLGTRTTAFLVSDLLAQEPDFLEIIERDELDSILEDENLPTSGLIDSKTAQEIKKEVDTDYLVVGKVISGEVNRNRVKDSLTQDDGSQETKISIEKEVYVEVVFKLIDVSSGVVEISENFQETETYRESYFENEPEVVTSDEQLLNDALKKVTERFSNLLLRRYSLSK
ncbi:MAG: CsgG/HfaB family protein [Bacillota bacterium]